MRRRAFSIVALFPLVVMTGIVALRPELKKGSLHGRTEGRALIGEDREVTMRQDAPASGGSAKDGTLGQEYRPEGIRLSGEWGDLRLSLRDIRIGERILTQGSPVEPVREGNEIHYRRGAVVEKYIARAGEVEQVFEMDTSLEPLRSEGDLRIAVGFDSSLGAIRRWNTVEFRDMGGNHVLTYGSATAIDACGRKQPLTYALGNGELDMVLDGGFLSSAQFPLVVDPLIGSDIHIEILSTVTGHLPDLAFSRYVNKYLAVYEDATSSTAGKILCRSIPTIGLASSPIQVSVSFNNARLPRVAWGKGGEFLVVWQQKDSGSLTWRIKGRIVNALGTTPSIPGPTFDISSDSDVEDKDPVRPDVGYSENGSESQYLVVWEHAPNSANSKLHAARVNTSGVVMPRIWLGNSSFYDSNATVSPRGGASLLIAWVQKELGTPWKIYGRSFNVTEGTYSDSVLLDPSPLAGDEPDLGGEVQNACYLTWSRKNFYTSSKWDTVARRITLGSTVPGITTGTVFTLNSLQDDVTHPRCSAVALGTLQRALFTYREKSTSSGWNIRCRIYNTEPNPPTPIESPLALSSALGDDNVSAAAMDGANMKGLAAFDLSDDKDVRGRFLSLVLQESNPPTAPINLTATAPSVNAINLSWNASTDDTGVKGYQVWRSTDGATFLSIGSTTLSTCHDLGLTAGTTYWYKVRAYDYNANFGSPNFSAWSSVVNATTPTPADLTVPSTPSNVLATAPSSTHIHLEWTASTDNVGVTAYKVFRSQGPATFAEIGQPTTTSFDDVSLLPSTAYNYKIQATDAAGNLSGFSDPVTVSTPAPTDTTAPSAVSDLMASSVSYNQVDLTWSAASDNVGVAGYKVLRDGGAFAPTTTTMTSFTDATVSSDSTYTYKVVAFDAAGNESAGSVVTVTTPAAPDLVPPTDPTGLSATSISSTQIVLTWTGSTDSGGSGLKEYTIYRSTDGANSTSIASTVQTSYQDDGLSGGTSYQYQVTAVDNDGNSSAFSIVAAATTFPSADVLPPTAPGNLGATVASVVQIDLSWTPSTDEGGAGLAGYKVERSTDGVSFTQIAIAPLPQFSDVGLSPGTKYLYRVRAYDNAGNDSAYGNLAEATTSEIASANPSASGNDEGGSGGGGGCGLVGLEVILSLGLLGLWRRRGRRGCRRA